MNDSFKHLPSLNALRVFESASRHLNFRVTADELDVTPSAVAQQIRSLEAALNIRLFERHPRQLVLTDNGRRYAQSVNRAFELLSDATASLQPASLHLTISVTPTFAAKWLIPRLPDFTHQYPEIDLRILATDRLTHFQTDDVDLAVRYGRPPFESGVNSHLLFSNRLIAVASPALVGRSASVEATVDISRLPLLHDAFNGWPLFLAHLPANKQSEAVKNIRFNQASLAIDAAVAGQGLALVNPAFVAADIAAGRLVQVFAETLITTAGFYLLTPHKRRAPEALDRVKRWLIQQVEKQPG